MVAGGGTTVPMSTVFFGSAVTTGVTSRTGSIVIASCGFGSMMRKVILLVPPGSSHTVVLVTAEFDGSNGELVPGARNVGFGTLATSTVCVCDLSVHPSAIGVEYVLCTMSCVFTPPSFAAAFARNRLTLKLAVVLPVLMIVHVTSVNAPLLMSGLLMSGLEMSGLLMSGLEISGLLISGFEISGFATTTLEMSGLEMSGLLMSGLEMSGLEISGLLMSGL